MVGVGAGSAIVAGQLNFDETTRSRRRSATPRARSQSATETEKLKQAGGAAGGATGTTANMPGAAATNGSAELASTTTTRSTATNAVDTDADRDEEGRRHADARCPSRWSSSKKALDERQAARRAPARPQIIQDTIANAIGLDTRGRRPTRSSSRPSTSSPNPVRVAQGRRRHGRRRRRGVEERQRARRADPGARSAAW